MGKWLDKHDTLSDDDHPHLEAKSASIEFGQHHPRETAEEMAYAHYLKEKAFDAAAHHLIGAKVAIACQDDELASKHGDAYHNCLTAAGLNPVDPVPQEVQDRIKAKSVKPYGFTAHPADALFSPEVPE